MPLLFFSDQVKEESGLPRSLQMHAGSGRSAGQEGYPWLVCPRQMVPHLRDIFNKNDSNGLETMAFLFGARIPTSRVATVPTYQVTDILVVEHAVTRTSCDMTDQGSDAFASFMRRHPHVVLVGWAHSHHQIPTGEKS